MARRSPIKHGFITSSIQNYYMPENRVEWIDRVIQHAESIHILGAGLNTERPANRAVHDLDKRGWRLVPIHPRDAGDSICGRVIRSEIETGIIPDIVVLFLAPARAKAAILGMVMKYQAEDMPLIWLQRGAEDSDLIEMLEDNNLRHVRDDCIVEYITRNEMQRDPPIKELPWFRQISDEDGSGCSVWQSYDPLAEGAEFATELEWAGDLKDLKDSEHTIARYIRSLAKPDETLLQTAIRLS